MAADKQTKVKKSTANFGHAPPRTSSRPPFGAVASAATNMLPSNARGVETSFNALVAGRREDKMEKRPAFAATLSPLGDVVLTRAFGFVCGRIAP